MLGEYSQMEMEMDGLSSRPFAHSSLGGSGSNMVGGFWCGHNIIRTQYIETTHTCSTWSVTINDGTHKTTNGFYKIKIAPIGSNRLDDSE